MSGIFFAALVAAILVFAWSLARVAALGNGRPEPHSQEEWYVVDASETALCRVGSAGGRSPIGSMAMMPRVVSASCYGHLGMGARAAGGASREPGQRERPIVWLLPGHTTEPGYLQQELARLKRMGAIRNYYRVVAYPGDAIDYRA